MEISARNDYDTKTFTDEGKQNPGFTRRPAIKRLTEGRLLNREQIRIENKLEKGSWVMRNKGRITE